MDHYTTIYKFPKECYSISLPDNFFTSFTISCDGSNAIIASKKQLSLFYFKKLYAKHKHKKIYKEILCDLFKNVGEIKMHPFFDEKEYFAGSFEKSILIYKVSKNSLNEERNYFNQHNDNVINISWQNCLNGLLASYSTDKIINFYNVKKNRDPMFFIKEDEQIKSIEFSYTNPNLLAVGYYKKLKIFDLNKVLHAIRNNDNNTKKNNTQLKSIYSTSTVDKHNILRSGLSDYTDNETNVKAKGIIQKNLDKNNINNVTPNNNSLSYNYKIQTNTALKGNTKLQEINPNIKEEIKDTKYSYLSNNTNIIQQNIQPNLKNVTKYVHPCKQIKEIFSFSSVDLINWYKDDNYLVVGSKAESTVKIINFVNMQIEGEINLNIISNNINNNTNFNKNKLIKCYFMKGNSILSVCESKIYIHIFNRYTKEITFNQVLEVNPHITCFKLMTSVVSYSYFVFTDKNNYLNLKKYIIDAYYNYNIKNFSSNVKGNLNKLINIY